MTLARRRGALSRHRVVSASTNTTLGGRDPEAQPRAHRATMLRHPPLNVPFGGSRIFESVSRKP